MATCAYCKTEETQLHENGVPICLKCSDTPTTRRTPPVMVSSQDSRAILLQEVLKATALCDEAIIEFDRVAAGQVPGELPHSDGDQSIVNAARKLTIARNEMVMAHNRINDCLEQDVPEEVKRSRKLNEARAASN